MNPEVRKVETTIAETGVGQSDRIDATYEIGFATPNGGWVKFASVPAQAVAAADQAAAAAKPPAEPEPAAPAEPTTPPAEPAGDTDDAPPAPPAGDQTG